MKRPIRAALAALVGCSTTLVAASVGAKSTDAAVSAPPTPAGFRAGAATADFTPPPAGSLPNDAADCLRGTPLEAAFSGPRRFAFEEPYVDQSRVGHYVAGDPFVDCNHDGRWDGNLLGGGASTPRFYDHVADPVTARAVVVSRGGRTLAVEVLDQEGVFDVYQQRIRQKVAADGYRLDGVFISATHDESAPDTLGLGGVNSETSGTNPYFVDYLVDKAARAIEQASAHIVPARIRYAEALEPANLRQCWSSYPYVDDQLMPVLQAVDTRGRTIATLGDVSQHAETLGFNPDPSQRDWVSSDWPHFFRDALEARYGGVGIEMAGSVGSVETPEVFSGPLSRTPQRFQDASHPAGCRTVFDPNGTQAPLGYGAETAMLGRALAGSVESALDTSGKWSTTDTLWGARASVCIPLANVLFAAAASLGVFSDRPGYSAGCAVQNPVLPNGTTSGDEVQTQVAAFRIGDGEFASLPGEAFPVTFLRGFLGPEDMPYPQYALPPWILPHLHAPYRFVDGLGEDMIGYIFPRGNGVGVPGEYPVTNPQANSTDRFGCGHSDDSESATSQAADLVGGALVGLLDAHDGHSEDVVTGRYVLPDGVRSRDPLGAPESLECTGATTFRPDGPAVAVWLSGGRVVLPAAWLSLSGRPQTTPDRDTRGWIDGQGRHHWLDVFPDVAGAPAT